MQLKRHTNLIDLNKLREYYEKERVIITIHAQERLRQRGIRAKDVMLLLLKKLMIY